MRISDWSSDVCSSDLLGLPAPIADIAYAYRNRESSKAIFAQVSYKVTDQLTATLGGRYTWVTVGITQAAGNVFGVDPDLAAATQRKSSEARSVGNERVSRLRSRGSPYHISKNQPSA